MTCIVEPISLALSIAETRANRAPIVETSIAINETIGKSPVFYARDLWNKLSIDNRNIDDIVKFKAAVRKDMYDAYVYLKTVI